MVGTLLWNILELWNQFASKVVLVDWNFALESPLLQKFVLLVGTLHTRKIHECLNWTNNFSCGNSAGRSNFRRRGTFGGKFQRRGGFGGYRNKGVAAQANFRAAMNTVARR